MPRERHELFRESNVKEKEKIFILAFEGNDTERIYFEAFKNSDAFCEELVFLHLLTRPKGDTKSAPVHVFNKLKKEAKDVYSFDKNDELWMIIDKDRWKNIPKIIEICKNTGNMFVAVSNPCFEFWLLLHIKKIDDYTPAELNAIYENKKVTSKKNYIETKISEILGTYNKSNPKPERFLPTIDLAVRQAKKLDKQHEEYPTTLGSHIYKIIEKISKEKY